MPLPRLLTAGICLITAAIPAMARGDDGGAGAPPPSARTLGDSAGAYNLRLGLESAAPALFTDTPDMTLSETTVFLYGASLGFSFGDEFVDAHRLGLRVSYDTAARSPEREMKLITPMLTYETGHPLALEVGLGWTIPTGTAGFTENYGGVTSDATLRWSFRNPARPSKVSVDLGLTGRVIAATSDFDYSSAYIGAQIAFALHFGKQGGSR